VERLRSHGQRGRGSAVDLPWADPGSEREVLPNFVKIGTNLSKQSSGEIEVEERFCSDRRTLLANGRLGWFWEPRRSGRLAGEAAGTPPRIGASRDRSPRLSF